jgi:hypothetical protein
LSIYHDIFSYSSHTFSSDCVPWLHFLSHFLIPHTFFFLSSTLSSLYFTSLTPCTPHIVLSNYSTCPLVFCDFHILPFAPCISFLSVLLLPKRG